jgi:hypothetical protein
MMWRPPLFEKSQISDWNDYRTESNPDTISEPTKIGIEK